MQMAMLPMEADADIEALDCDCVGCHYGMECRDAQIERIGMSKIEWTDATWNPVTGCSRVSPGCDRCYMFAQYPRLRAMGAKGYEGEPTDVRQMWDRLDKPLRWRKPRMVFVNSMSDLFHPHVEYEFISQVFNVMRHADQHIFQVLTKRPGNAVGWWQTEIASWFNNEWPAHIWIGVSVESQKYAPRIDVLERLPAPVKFVSAEPLLAPLDLTAHLRRGALQWVICGGESGRGARPMSTDWARDLRDQCADAATPFFLKQMGGYPNKRGGVDARLDGALHRAMPPREMAKGE